MGRNSARRTAFPRITLDVVRYACEHPAEASPYYIRECGRDAIKGCMLRVHRRAVELGTRYAKGTRWHRIAVVDVHMSIEELLRTRKRNRALPKAAEKRSVSCGKPAGPSSCGNGAQDVAPGPWSSTTISGTPTCSRLLATCGYGR